MKKASPRQRAINYATRTYPVRDLSPMGTTLNDISRRIAIRHFLAGYRTRQRDAKKEAKQ